MSFNLPIEEVLPEVRATLETRNELVLEAPPGAGKTTVVPLALVTEPWLAGKKILILEPRRLATKSAAYRMASLLDESPGQTVGYRMRLDSNVGAGTRIEVITEGIMTRMLQQDPSLEDVGLVIFDEFHERNLDSDLALALCLNGRSLFRDEDNPLKILVMSATMDGQKVATLLNDAPLIRSEGKLYPVDVVYGGPSRARERIVDRTVAMVIRALKENGDSSVLVFLPGQGEIRRTNEELASKLRATEFSDVHLRPLYGNLSIEEQQMAIAPGHRKVVLATNIAETSLTIEGIDVVVDSGLVREPFFDPATAMTRLHTRKISRASSVQRMGRAGRLRPGRCYRLWSADQQQQLAPHISPEMLQADLAPLALQLLQWGVDDPWALNWLDPPGAGQWNQAIDLLHSLGALNRSEGSLTLTRHGKMMSSLSVHPRIAHMLLCAVNLGVTQIAVLLAATLSDRDPFSDENPDIGYRVSLLLGEEPCHSRYRGWLNRTRRLSSQFEREIAGLGIADDPTNVEFPRKWMIGYLLASGYPDRIARRRHAGGFQMANGRSARLAFPHALGKARWLAIGETSGTARSKGDIIRSAALLDGEMFDSLLADLIGTETVVEWDKKAKRFVAERRRSIGALVIDTEKLSDVPMEAKRQALLTQVRDSQLDVLPWTKALRQWQARVLLVRSAIGDASWPDVSNEGLLGNVSVWLGPYLDSINKLTDFKQLDLKKILEAQLPWPLPRQLAELAPTRIEVPSGSNIAIDYSKSPPVLAVKLQEMFGCHDTPSVVEGKVQLMLHLLSPAGRPLQITQDLSSFWRSSYQEVRKEMKGRYPKHPWPDDPLAAVPTSRAKQRP